ncbi:19902_t:CDS:2, partial [Entrophospora sp. SA101]
AACRSCIKANPNKPIEDLYFTNKKETCLNHLKHCKHFKEEIGEAEYQQIINLDKSSTSNPTLVNKNSLSDDHEARNLSEEMVNIIESEGWWRNLEQLTILLHPISAILNQLQKYTAKLYDIMHGFAYIMKIVKLYPDENFKIMMIDIKKQIVNSVVALIN